jgi:hypothetical protein
MSETDEVLAIAGALDEDEQTHILDAFAGEGTPNHGATVADLLALAYQHDMFLPERDPFFDAHEDRNWPQPAASYAALAVVMHGDKLTTVRLTKLLLKAGLLPPATTALDWGFHSTPPMRAVTGYVAEGETWKYFVTRTPDDRFLLCRWRKNLPPAGLEALRQAVGTAIEVSTPDEGRHFADQFEHGLDIDHAVAWQHTRRPGMRVT